MRAGAFGEYSYQVLKDGKPTGKEGSFHNDLLDGFFTLLTTADIPIYYYGRCHVGTGTSPTDFTMTSLEAPLANKDSAWASESTAVLNEDGTLITVYRQYTTTFAIGAVVGNVSEIGFRVANGSGNIHSRALVRDQNGTPTYIQVEADEQLIIVYKLTLAIPTAEQVETVTLTFDGVESIHQLKCRLSSATGLVSYLAGNASSGVRLRDANAAFNASLSATSGGTTEDVAKSFVTGSVQGERQYRITASINQANWASGVKYVSFNGFKFEFDPAIPKNLDQQLVLTFKQNFGRV